MRQILIECGGQDVYQYGLEGVSHIGLGLARAAGDRDRGGADPGQVAAGGGLGWIFGCLISVCQAGKQAPDDLRSGLHDRSADQRRRLGLGSV